MHSNPAITQWIPKFDLNQHWHPRLNFISINYQHRFLNASMATGIPLEAARRTGQRLMEKVVDWYECILEISIIYLRGYWFSCSDYFPIHDFTIFFLNLHSLSLLNLPLPGQWAAFSGKQPRIYDLLTYQESWDSHLQHVVEFVKGRIWIEHDI